MSASACSGTCTMNFALPAGTCVSACCTASRQSADRSQRRRKAARSAAGRAVNPLSASAAGTAAYTAAAVRLPMQDHSTCSASAIRAPQITRAFVPNDPQAAVAKGTVAPQIRQQCTAAVRDHFDRVDRSVDVSLCGAGRLCIYAPEQYIPCAAAQERIQLLHRVQTGKLLCRVAAPLDTQRIAHCEQRRMPQLGAQQQLADCVAVQLRKKKMRLPSLSSQNTV